MEDKNPPDQVDDLLTEIVNKDPIVPAAISLVPYVGGSLATFFSSKWQQVSRERTEALLKQFGEELRALDERSINKEYFDTEEGFDVLLKATEASAKTRNEEKRHLFARILVGATSTHSARGEYSPEEYLNLISELTEKELQIARTIYSRHHQNSPEDIAPTNRAETWRLVNEKLIEQHGIEEYALPLYLNRLHLAGLLNLEYVVRIDGSASPTYWVSESFKNLMNFLELGKL